jgi:DNA polymerase-4
MSTFEAKRLCPHAVFLSGRYDVYQSVSQEIFEVFAQISPLVEGLSLDEAFIDASGAQGLFGEPVEIAQHLRRLVADATQLRASVGIATNKTLAKLASKAAKPPIGPPGSSPQPSAGVYVVPPGDEQRFLRSLPVRALWGVGRVTGERLAARGITQVAQLEQLSIEQLRRTFGDAQALHLYQICRAIDGRPVVPNADAKSIGQEETYLHDRHTKAELQPELTVLADRVGNRLANAETQGQTVTLKLRFASLRSITRSKTLAAPTSDPVVIRTTAQELLDAVEIDEPVRLCGISMSKLGQAAAVQLSLVDSVEDSSGVVDLRSSATARALADVRKRFGRAAIGPASLLGSVADRSSPWGPTLQEPSADNNPTRGPSGDTSGR